MIRKRPSRREILQATAALTAAASLGATVGRAVAAQPHAQVDAVLRRATEAKEVPGVVAVAATDKGPFYEGAFGMRDLANGPEMTPDTIFRLASMTKAITSTAAMQLVEQGKLQLDQPIGNVLPELAAPQVLEGFDDSAGRAVEAVSGQPLEVYFREHIFAPLGMADTDYVISSPQQSRLVSVHQRKPDNSLEPVAAPDPPWREFWSGGGGLYSTGRDYLVFLQMLLNQGRFNGVQLLRPETVALMGRNQIGDINAGILKTAMPQRSNHVDFFPGIRCKWGLGYMINTEPGPNGRSAGSLTWAGIYNTYYWLDPQKHVAGVILTQVLPFADHKAVKLYGEFESAVYDALKAA